MISTCGAAVPEVADQDGIEEEKDLAFIAFHASKFIMMRRKEQQDAMIRRMSAYRSSAGEGEHLDATRRASRAQEGGARLRQGYWRDLLFSSRSTESRETRASGVGLSELSVEQTTGRRYHDALQVELPSKWSGSPTCR